MGPTILRKFFSNLPILNPFLSDPLVKDCYQPPLDLHPMPISMKVIGTEIGLRN